MFERIIVAYDGSKLSGAAFAHALDFAERLRLPVFVFHAIEPIIAPPVIADPIVAMDPMPTLVPASTFEEQREWAEKAFERLEQRAGERGVSIKTRAADGELIPLLCNLATPRDLIALGKKGRFLASGVGSATRELVRRAPCPVLVVSETPHEVSRVLAVHEGSEASDRAVALAQKIATGLGAPLEALIVAARGVDAGDAKRRAQQAAPGCGVVDVAGPDSDEHSIVGALEARSENALIVLGAFEDSWLRQIMFGSTAPRVLRQGNAPVVLVH